MKCSVPATLYLKMLKVERRLQKQNRTRRRIARMQGKIRGIHLCQRRPQGVNQTHWQMNFLYFLQRPITLCILTVDLQNDKLYQEYTQMKKEDKEKKSPKKPKKSDKSVTSKKSKKSSPKKSPSGTPKKSPSATPKKVSPAVTPKETSPVSTPKKASPPPTPPPEPALINNGENLETIAQSPQRPVIPKPGLTAMLSMCQIHGQPFSLYCESCEEVICYECNYSGLHRDTTHRIVDIKDAFGARLEYMTSRIGLLLRKRDTVLAQIDKVEYRTSEIKSVSGIIEKDIKTEYAGMLERGKFAEGTKLAILQHDLANLQKDIERIDSVLNSIDEYTQGEPKADPATFLAKFRELNEYIEYALAKPFKERIEASPQDLPNEYADRVATLENSERIEKLLQLKDNLISDLLSKAKKAKDFPAWERLQEIYEQRLSAYRMVCGYCGVSLNEVTVNGKCFKNTGGRKVNRGNFIVEEPPNEFNGNEQHFFGRPLSKSNKSFITRIMIDRMASTAYNAIKTGSADTVRKIIKEIQDRDKKDKGKISVKKFVGAFKEKYDIEDECFNRLAIALDPNSEKSKKIEYKRFLDYIEKLCPEVPERTPRKYPANIDDEKPRVSPPIMARTTTGKSLTSASIYASTSEFSKINTPSKQYFKELDTEAELVRSILGMLKKKGIAERQLLAHFEKYDTMKKRVVPIDVFYIVFTKLDVIITNVDIEVLIKKWNPDALHRGNINYVDFLRRLFQIALEMYLV
eukprot:TRINITY_DN87978_c0_g1_i1.p1 TRINITY_DN87978_c0_g1~~TRINITY_DN87978_c0_g1_i1.p1  ORF type:complete len:746 (+),score=67.32 TRINITY_DN87978_c0_g1_i1:5676-7913(+)